MHLTVALGAPPVVAELIFILVEKALHLRACAKEPTDYSAAFGAISFTTLPTIGLMLTPIQNQIVGVKKRQFTTKLNLNSQKLKF